MITGICYILYTVTLLVILFGDGGRRGRWPHPGIGGTGIQTTTDCYFEAERQGRLRPPRREVGLALVGVRGYLNTVNEILVFDLSLATGLYALTIYAGTVMCTRHRGISRSIS